MTKNQASLASLVKKPEQEPFNPLKNSFKDDADMRTAAVVIILTALLSLTAAGTQLVSLARANPYLYLPIYSNVSPPSGTQAPIITIHTPQNGSFYLGNVTLTFDIIIPQTNGDKSIDTVKVLYHNSSWELNETQIEKGGWIFENTSFSIDLHNVPEGNLSLTIYAVSSGTYETRTELGESHSGGTPTRYHYYDYFEMISSSTVYFTIDTTIPKILSLSIENKTYYTAEIPFILKTDEPLSQISYSLDGQENATVAGNTTLMNLSYGEHNVTAYVTDEAGNTGNSETIHFTIEPFPTVPVVAVSAVSIAAVTAAGLVLFARRKRRREAQQT